MNEKKLLIMKNRAVFSKRDTDKANFKMRKEHSRSLSDIRLDFMEGERLGDVDILIEDRQCVRRVRRVMEKQIAQRLCRQRHLESKPTSRFLKNELNREMKDIFGVGIAETTFRFAA